MRLNSRERDIIRSEMLKIDPGGKVFLFGSRTDDSKRGGDIDLLVETSRKLDYKNRLVLEYSISSSCDTKVDMIFKSPEDDETPIYRIAKRTGIAL